MSLPRPILTMRGRLEQCWLFVYRSPVDAVRPLLPPPLQPVTWGGFAFWNIVVCEISGLRPRGLPAWAGVRYRQVAYRIHARLPAGSRDAGASAVEGLYFLRSDCDLGILAVAGNILTDFRFHAAPIGIDRPAPGIATLTVSAEGAGGMAIVDARGRPELGWHSPFRDLDEASATLRYAPNGLAPAGDGRHARVVPIRRDESAWRSRPVRLPYARWEFLDPYPAEPELAFAVDPIDYEWRRGRIAG